MFEFKSARTEISVEGIENPIIIESSLFLGRESLSIALSLGKLVVPFVKCISGIEKSTGILPVGTEDDPFKNLTITPEFFKSMAEQLISTMDEKKVTDLIFRIVKGTRVNNQEISKPEVFDVVFQGGLGLLLEVLKFILESNFSSFFKVGGVAKILQKVSTLAK